MVLHLLLCILCSALVYLWFLSSCIVPHGMNILELDEINVIQEALKDIPPS